MISLNAGYSQKNLPALTGAACNTGGKITNTEKMTENPGGRPPQTAAPEPSPLTRKLGKLEAMEQAGKDVTKVYQVGKSYRFAVRDQRTGEWLESGPLDTEQEAYEKRMQAYKRRLDELTGQQS